MFDKILFFILLGLFAEHAFSQSIHDAAGKSRQGSNPSTSSLPGPPISQPKSTSSTQAIEKTEVSPSKEGVKSASVTIGELAARQAAVLAADADKKVTPTTIVASAPSAAQQPIGMQRTPVPELVPVKPIPVSMDKELSFMKSAPATPPPPPKPYIAAVIGLKGKEMVEVLIGNSSSIVRVGDSITNWRLDSIVDGKLFVSSFVDPSPGDKKKKSKKDKTPDPVKKSRILNVGDYL
jgi:hypothetical protein